MEQNKPAPRPGMLVEDSQALEVRGADGRDRIEKTVDREGLDRQLRENEGGDKPTHGKVNG